MTSHVDQPYTMMFVSMVVAFVSSLISFSCFFPVSPIAFSLVIAASIPAIFVLEQSFPWFPINYGSKTSKIALPVKHKLSTAELIQVVTASIQSIVENKTRLGLLLLGTGICMLTFFMLPWWLLLSASLIIAGGAIAVSDKLVMFRQRGLLHYLSKDTHDLLLKRSLFDMIYDFWKYPGVSVWISRILLMGIVPMKRWEARRLFNGMDPNAQAVVARKGIVNLLPSGIRALFFPAPVNGLLGSRSIESTPELEPAAARLSSSTTSSFEARSTPQDTTQPLVAPEPTSVCGSVHQQEETEDIDPVEAEEEGELDEEEAARRAQFKANTEMNRFAVSAPLPHIKSDMSRLQRKMLASSSLSGLLQMIIQHRLQKRLMKSVGEMDKSMLRNVVISSALGYAVQLVVSRRARRWSVSILNLLLILAFAGTAGSAAAALLLKKKIAETKRKTDANPEETEPHPHPLKNDREVQRSAQIAPTVSSCSAQTRVTVPDVEKVVDEILDTLETDKTKTTTASGAVLATATLPESSSTVMLAQKDKAPAAPVVEGRGKTSVALSVLATGVVLALGYRHGRQLINLASQALARRQAKPLLAVR
eukprot:GILJ01006379.1.p1 GENE.GILJ01006379.1~~GILJ01006379.1.p1  ORF type:complete len:592 (+),score=81.12 GILJ01006379.1:108-1883(+)